MNRPEGHGESIHAVDYAKIVEAVVKDHAHSEGLFLGDVLSAKKERNARRTCGIPDDARIVALIDCTVFGSAKNCLVFTEWGVYCHNDWTGRSSGKI